MVQWVRCLLHGMRISTRSKESCRKLGIVVHMLVRLTLGWQSQVDPCQWRTSEYQKPYLGKKKKCKKVVFWPSGTHVYKQNEIVKFLSVAKLIRYAKINDKISTHY